MPALTYTRRQLIDRALDNLGVLAAGQTPSAEDLLKVDALIDPMLASLSARDVVFVADPGEPVAVDGEFDAAIVLPLAAILADRAKVGWGLAGDSSLYVLAQQAEDELRTIGRPARTRRTLSVDRALRVR